MLNPPPTPRAVLSRHVYGTDRHVEVYESTGDDLDGRYGVDRAPDGTSAITMALRRIGGTRIEADGTSIHVNLNGYAVMSTADLQASRATAVGVADAEAQQAGADHPARRCLAARVALLLDAPGGQSRRGQVMS